MHGSRRETIRRRRSVAIGLVLATLGVVGGLVARAAWPEPPPPITAEGKQHPPAPEDPAGSARTCSVEHLDVRLRADRDTFEKDERVTFTVTLENTGPTPCLVDGGEANRPVTIWEGDPDDEKRVWSSADCAPEERMLLLGPDFEVTDQVRWTGRRSTPECDAPEKTKDDASSEDGEKKGDRKKAKKDRLAPGTYSARVTLVDVVGAESDVVEIERPEPPKPSPTPTPTPSGTPSSTPRDSEEPTPTSSPT